jgi:ABC-type dipeptide/oligopeptide/nickel transport system ATPase subunit
MKILSFKSVDYRISEKNLITGIVTDKEILSDINFDIEDGEVLAIAGESGSGKTTIAKLACGLIQPSKGKITLNGQRKTRSSAIQILFQNNDEILNPFRTVNSILKEAFRLGKNSKTYIEEDVGKYLDLLKLNKDILDRKGSELSGGERIRVALIRILAVEPELLILDEPFSAQDQLSIWNFSEVFEKLKTQQKLSLMIVTHNIAAVKNLADKIIILKEGKIVEYGDYQQVVNNSSEKYTQFLINAGRYDLKENDFHDS